MWRVMHQACLPKRFLQKKNKSLEIHFTLLRIVPASLVLVGTSTWTDALLCKGALQFSSSLLENLME
jgi:hypothetical protein